MIKLLRFGSSDCTFCKAMDRARVLERFWYKHADIQVEKLYLEDEDPRVETWNLKHLPTCIFVDTLSGKELTRSKATDPMNLATLERLLEEANARSNA